jgi:hypothetical protein
MSEIKRCLKYIIAYPSYLFNHNPITNLVCTTYGYGKYTIIIIIIIIKSVTFLCRPLNIPYFIYNPCFFALSASDTMSCLKWDVS